MKYKLILVVALFFSLQCWANVPIKLNIDGTTSFTSFVAPSNTYSAVFTGATQNGNCIWSVRGGADIFSNGDNVVLRFRGPITPGPGITVTLTCTVNYTKDGESGIESKSINITWSCPGVSLNITGPTEVLEDVEETYSASVSSMLNDADNYTWKINNQEKLDGDDSSFTTAFQDWGGQTISLSCEAIIADTRITTTTSINVHTYSMTVTRWDYSGELINGKVIHTHSTTFDNVLMFVHFNVDDDDSSATGKSKGWDFKQPFFTKNATDDDLCELVINLTVSGDAFDISDLNKTLTISTPSNLRVWSSQSRKWENSLVPENSSVSWSGDQLNNIIGETIYVEGIEHNAKGCLEISFGKITKRLQYATCSVGGEEDQPTKKQRKEIKKRYENLVDCEWYVLRGENNNNYNCIAFSVDPYQNRFENTNLINKDLVRSHMDINNNYPLPFWINAVCITRNPDILNQNSTTDKFWLFLYTKGWWKYLYLLSKSQKIYYDLNVYCYYGISQHGEFFLAGYEDVFKSNITSVVNYLGLSNYRAVYLLAMNDFNPNGRTNQFDSTADVNAFFTNSFWASAEGNNLTICENADDPERVIRYYNGFHAARRASTLKGKEKVEEKNMPPGWFIFASKNGPFETIIHREEQIEGKDYGKKDKSYKY